MKILMFLVLLLIPSTTFSQGNKIPFAKYKYEGIESHIIQKLILYNDSSFIYNIYGDLLNSKSEGKWISTKNGFILHSDTEYKTGFIEVKESIINKRDRKILVLDKKYNEPQEFVSIFINCDLNKLLITNNNGTALLPNFPIDSLLISSLGQDYIYHIKDTASNNLLIYLLRKDLSMTYFDSELWIKNDKILYSPSLEEFKLMTDKK